MRHTRRTDSATAVLSHNSTRTAALLLAYLSCQHNKHTFKGRGSGVTLVKQGDSWIRSAMAFRRTF